MDVKLMQRRRTKNGHVGGFVVQASKHILMMILFAVLFIGLICGNFFVKESENTYETVGNLFQDYISSLSGQTLLRTFLVQSMINIVILALTFVFGLCAIGFPVPIILMLIKGISIGALSGFMYTEYALKGFGYCMLVFYPVQIISCLILLRAGKESFSMSKSIFKILTEQRQKAGDVCDLKLYLLRYFILFIAMIIVSFISAILSVYVIPLFKF